MRMKLAKFMQLRNEHRPRYTCPFCGRSATHEICFNDGWEPCWWHNDACYDIPVCPACCKEHLSYCEETGEPELKKGHKLPNLAGSVRYAIVTLEPLNAYAEGTPSNR